MDSQQRATTDALCRNVERLEELVGAPSPEWPMRRTLGSLSVHAKLRLNRVRSTAAHTVDPTAAAALDRAVDAATALQFSLQAATPKPIVASPRVPAISPSDRHTEASEVEPTKSPAAVHSDSLDSHVDTRAEQLVTMVAVGVVGICAGVLFFRSRRSAFDSGDFGTTAPTYAPLPSTPRERQPLGSSAVRENSGRKVGFSTDRERESARRHRAENLKVAGTGSWVSRSATGTLLSVRENARQACAQLTSTSSFDRKVVQFNSNTRRLVTSPTTEPVRPTPPGKLFGPIRRVKLPPPPATPARELHKISVRDAALLSAFQRTSRTRPTES